jgi:hypothetical protein
MSRKFPYALFAGLLFASGLPAPAGASVLVDYNLTFTGPVAADVGTGILALNLPSLPDNNQINFTNLPNSIFSSLTATIGSLSFTLTNANIAFGGIQGTNGSSIDISVTESTAVGDPILAIFNGAANAGTFQIQRFNRDGTLASGTYTIGSPFAAAVPEASTWAMMILGFAGIGFMAYRRRKSTVGLATA